MSSLQWLENAHYVTCLATIAVTAALRELSKPTLEILHGLLHAARDFLKGHSREAAAAYAAWYVTCVPARCTFLNLGGKSRSLRRAVMACPSLRATYFPTFWAPTTVLQMAQSAAREVFGSLSKLARANSATQLPSAQYE